MERLGTKYVIPCVLTASGDFMLLESFKCVETPSKGKVHVSLCTGLAGNLFAKPGIKCRGGVFEPLGKEFVGKVLEGRSPIYFSINNMMCAVEVKGDYLISEHRWSEDTIVTFYTMVDSISVNGKLYAVFEPDSRYNSVGISSFSIDGHNYISFDVPKSYCKAVLSALEDRVQSKKNYYLARVGGF